MAVCDIQALLSANPCIAATPQRLLEAAEIQILCDLKNWLTTGTGTMTCDIQTLLTENPCNANIPDGLVQAVKIQLLCDISGLISGTSALGFLSGHGAPENNVTGLRLGQTYANLDVAGALYTFTGTVGTKVGWHLV